jgi:GGDEF domain-containing protein
MIVDDLSKQNIQTTNMFKTILYQNSLQLISNPDVFQRVAVSDLEGQVLVQYGALIPGLDVLSGNSIFKNIIEQDSALSNFYFDPALNKVCFDIGLKNKNRIYIGTVTVDDFINKFLGNADLAEFIVLDRNNLGYLFIDNVFTPINMNNDHVISWINSTILNYHDKLYYYVGRRIDEILFISFAPVVENILALFLIFLIPFFFGLLMIHLVKRIVVSERIERNNVIKKIYQIINAGMPVPVTFLDDKTDNTYLLYEEFNDLLSKNNSLKIDTMRYSTKLGDYSEYLKGLKLNLEYIQRYFEELQLKKNLQIEDALLEVFRMFFSESDSTAYATLSINDNEFFSCGEKSDTTFEPVKQSVELGSYHILMTIAFNQKQSYDLKQLEILLFKIFVKYLLYVYIIKNNEYTNEFVSARNFKLFSDLVSKEIHKANRYNLNGVLSYFALKNRDVLIDKYGTEIFQLITDSVSAVLRSEIRKSDIIGTYKEGFFLVYFYDIDHNRVNEKINKMVEKISIEEKIKQLGIEIKIKTGFFCIEKTTKNFDTVFGKLLIEEDNEA